MSGSSAFWRAVRSCWNCWACVQFLQLNSTQAQQFQQLLTARQKALEPLIQQITALNTQLQGLLDSDGPAPAIGQTVIQIHQLQVQVGQVQQSFLERSEEHTSELQSPM